MPQAEPLVFAAECPLNLKGKSNLLSLTVPWQPTLVEVSISFIEKELIPYIDANYPTEPYRMFIGHSLGGLTVMYTLMHNPDLFNTYTHYCRVRCAIIFEFYQLKIDIKEFIDPKLILHLKMRITKENY